MKRPPAVCFLCGKAQPAPSTREHVISRCIYGGPLPNDVVTLPAHRECNAHTTRQEESFRNFIAAGIAPENPGHRLWTATWRAIHDPKAPGLRRAYFEGILSREVTLPDGSTARDPLAVTTHETNVDWVLAKIVKGLFARETGEVLPNRDLRWRFGHLVPWGDAEVSLPKEFNLHDVLKVRWGRASDDPLSTVWVLRFYDTHFFHAATSPSRRYLSNRARKFKAMIWPGPQR